MFNLFTSNNKHEYCPASAKKMAQGAHQLIYREEIDCYSKAQFKPDLKNKSAIVFKGD